MPPARYIAESELLARCRWLLRLRWAIIGLITGALLLNLHWRFQLNAGPIWILTGAAATYNLLYGVYARYRLSFCLIAEAPELRRRISHFAATQMILDLAALTVLIRYTGGIENPLALFYIFHMIIAGILLSRRASNLMATFATLLYTAMAVGDMLNVLPHHAFFSAIVEPFGLYQSRYVVIPTLVAFACVMFATVYMTTSIVRNLRRREAQLVATTAHLSEANARLQNLERHKSQFMLVAAHQLKSPLSAITSLLQVAAAEGLDRGKRLQLEERATNRAKGAIRQIEELLHLARLREVAPERQSWQVLDFREVVNSVRVATTGQTEAKRQSLSVSVPEHPVHVEGSAADLFDAVLNLVENAIKYTGDAGRIDIALVADNGGCDLSVKDSGCGIPEAEVPRLFQEFFRSSNVIRAKIPGTGLGLSIVQEIITLHRGRISVTSQENRGTVFNVWLPVAP